MVNDYSLSEVRKKEEGCESRCMHYNSSRLGMLSGNEGTFNESKSYRGVLCSEHN